MGAQVKTAYATLVGETVSSRYRVVGEVGRTDFGVLYLAEDTLTPGRSVAINVLVGELPSQEAERRRFELETESLARRADIDLTDFINTGRLADGRPFWVLACEAVVPELISPEEFKKAVTPTAQPLTEVGQRQDPYRLERYEHVPVYRRQPFLLSVYALPVLLAVIASVGLRVVNPEEPVRSARGFDRQLNYTVWAQRYVQGVPAGDPHAVELPHVFGSEERLQLEVSTPEEGYLYAVHELTARAQNGIPHYELVFPARGAGERAAYVQSTHRITLPAQGYLQFEPGDSADRLWLIWSSVPLDQFDALPRDARMDATQVLSIQQLISRRSSAPVASTVDPATKRTQLSARSDPWIHLISLGRE